MTKQGFLTNVLKQSGMKGPIYTSLKSMKHDNGTYYAGILRCTDTPVRAKSKKKFLDQEDSMSVRRKHYDVSTVYSVVIADQNEEKLEKIVEEFLVNLGKGFDDGKSNWVGVEAGVVDWVDEEDCVLKSKIAVEIPVTCTYGIYKDVKASYLPGSSEIKMGD